MSVGTLIAPKISSAPSGRDCGFPKTLDFTKYFTPRIVGILQAKGKALAI
jgi:hypothetical protein